MQSFTEQKELDIFLLRDKNNDDNTRNISNITGEMYRCKLYI